MPSIHIAFICRGAGGNQLYCSIQDALFESVDTLPHHSRIAVSCCVASTALLFSADTTSVPRFSWSHAYSGADRNVAHP